jgi:hypothetical protein
LRALAHLYGFSVSPDNLIAESVMKAKNPWQMKYWRVPQLTGIKKGDRIMFVDGKKSSRLSLPDVRLIFKGPVSTRVTLSVERDKSTRRVVLVLKDLV